MSEFIAEAQILVRPNTTGFRAELEASLAASLKPITIPVAPVVAGNAAAGLAATTASAQAASAAQHSVAVAAQEAGASAATAAVETVKLAAADETAAVSGSALDAALTQQAVSSQALNAALNGVFLSTEKVAVAQTEAAAAITGASIAQSRATAQGLKGIVAQGASLLGLRAGTLAASSAFIAGTVAVLGFAKAVQSAAKFETELNVFRVTTKATADEFARAGAEAKQLGRDITLPGVTAGDAAVAMTELAKAGLSVEDAMNGARGALQLATAAQIDNVTATKLVAGALNAFQLSGNEAVKVADLLTGAANQSQGEISDMGTALGQAAAVSHLFGVSLSDTVTLLTELAQAGIEGGRAGTSLRVAFLRLVNPPAQAAKVLKELNVQIRDVNGNLRPEVFTDITKALSGYTKAQQQAKLATIFGSDAIRAAAIIGAKGAAGFTATSDAINEFGLAQQQAAARTSGLQGAAENLSNQVSALGLTIGEVAKGPLTSFVNETALVVGSMAEGVGAAAKFGGAIKGLGSDIAGSIPFMDKLVTAVKLFDEAVLLGPVGVAKFGADIGHAFGVGANAVKADAASVRADILSIVKAGEQTGGQLGLNQTLFSLDLLVAKLNKGGPAAQKFASEVAGVRTELAKAGNSGFKLFPDDVTKLFPPDLLTGAVAKKAGETNRDALEQALSGRDLFSFTKASFDNVTKAIVVAGAEAESAARTSFANVVNAAKEQISSLNEQFDIAAAGGSKQGELAALRKQAAEQQKIRDAADAAAKDIGAGNKGFATAVAKRRAAQHELASLNDQIRGIESQIASDAAATAASVKASKDKALQAQLDALKARKDAAAKIQKAIDDQKQAQLAQQRAIEESLQLDISFAQTKDNQSGEIKAREALIAQLKKEQASVKRGTNEWKNLRNEIADQVAAIDALNKEKQKQNAAIKSGQSFAKASFDFLQAQQGFASNLLGNLIPSSATGGLVGGGSGPVQTALTPVADTSSKSGPTAGQANATNHILQQILQTLKAINGTTQAPEARQWMAWQNAQMDGVGGG